MTVKKTSVTYPTDLQTILRQNLRLPDGFDTDLVLAHLASAIDYVEDQTNINITAKTVTQVWSGKQNKYILSWQPNEITSIHINDEEITDVAVVHKDSEPSFFFIPEASYVDGDNVIKVIYTCTAATILPALKQLIIAIASNYYSNPEGLAQKDQRRVQQLLNSYLNQI